MTFKHPIPTLPTESRQFLFFLIANQLRYDDLLLYHLYFFDERVEILRLQVIYVFIEDPSRGLSGTFEALHKGFNGEVLVAEDFFERGHAEGGEFFENVTCYRV
jgi:hypothetical protein